MISVAEADRLLAELAPPAQTEEVPLDQAVDRILAAHVAADRDGPPYDRVAMDGYAVAAAERDPWTVASSQFAGRPPLTRPDGATAIEVATGSVLPLGCDAVVPYEQTVRSAETVTLLAGMNVLPRQHVHGKGADYRQGQPLLASGTRLRSPHLHALASVGVDRVPVLRRLRWSLGSTGDELVEVDSTPEPWQIRRSNAQAIAGEAGAWGLSPSRQRVLPDDPLRLRAGVEELLAGADVLVLTGGVSAGKLDLVPSVLADLGYRTVFHKISQKPGKPLWCGVSKGVHPTVVFGLPGNPVSSLFAFRRYVLPWLLGAEGRRPPDQRIEAWGLKPPPAGQTVFLPWSTTEGPLAAQGSGDFLSLTRSTGFIEVSDPSSLTHPLYYPWGGLP